MLPFSRFKAGPRSWKLKAHKTEAAYQRAWSKGNPTEEPTHSYAHTCCNTCTVHFNMAAIGDDYELFMHTFMHELEHVVLFTLGVNPDEHDEREVDIRAAIQAQILLSGLK